MLDDYLGKRIFGSQYIEDSISLKKRLPKDSDYFHPLLSRCFEGSVVTCDNSIDAVTERKLRQYVELMGGIFEGYNIPYEAKYFISTSSLHLRFQVAAQRSLEIVGPEWVVDSFKVFKKLPTEKYIMPPLKGCIIGTLGFSSQSNREISQIVKSLGGSISGDFKTVTHIIVASSLEPDDYVKYKSVQKLKSHIVTLEWLLDSVNANSGLSTAQYVPRVEDPGAKPQARRKSTTPSYLENSMDPKITSADSLKASDARDIAPEKRNAEKGPDGGVEPKKPKGDGLGNNGNGKGDDNGDDDNGKSK